MKICILGDTHFGSRNDSSTFHDYYELFYNDLFEYLRKNDIRCILQLGDLFDRRKYINFNSLFRCRNYFFERLIDEGIEFHTLVGNHDIFWKESLEVNSSSLLLGEYESDIFKVHTSPTALSFQGCLIDVIPWICSENSDEIQKFISASESDVCVGHFEIAGFAMYRGAEAHDGLSRTMFGKYDLVLSGHYHTRSCQDNITYVGTPYEMTWQDFNDPRGFHILDTDTKKLSFIENTHKMFYRYEYSDDLELDQVDFQEFSSKYVKIIVTAKNDHYKFDKFITSVYNSDPHDVKIVEDLSSFSQGQVDDSVDLEDTLDVMTNYIDSIETDVDKSKIKTFMKTLYTEALNNQVV